MLEFFSNLLDNDFMPHGHCYLWKPEILWPHVLGDGLTAVSYFVIPLLLFYFVKERPEKQFNVIYLAFAAFILFCGATHLLAIVSVWNPIYRLEAVIKSGTALVSFSTVILVAVKMPTLLAIPSRREINDKNETLQKEVTQRKEVEEKLQHLNETLEDRVKRRTAELRSANKELEMFSSMVSHDLRSPLSALGELLKLMKEEKNNEAFFNQSLEAAIERTESISQLVEDLRNLTKLRDVTLRKETIPLNEVVDNKLREAFHVLGLNKSLYSISVSPLPSVLGDRTLITQVFQNLLNNAVKYSQEADSPRISITSKEKDSWYEISIQDNGVGFDNKNAKELFKPFKRLDSGIKFEGTGLGLSIVKRIMKLHGGNVKAKSEPGNGATFILTFPLAY